ncbi:MAG TPA: hypothetical protein VJH03_00100 [Blastocatellia bacterium]|nr:hypothetical protein [Blastocatellia bacterium]
MEPGASLRKLFDFEYPLAVQLTCGKDRIPVKFKAHTDAVAGSVFEVRLVQ